MPGNGEIQAALEQACAELGYTLDQVARMLRPGPGHYNEEVIRLVMRKTR